MKALQSLEEPNKELLHKALSANSEINVTDTDIDLVLQIVEEWNNEEIKK